MLIITLHFVNMMKQSTLTQFDSITLSIIPNLDRDRLGYRNN